MALVLVHIGMQKAASSWLHRWLSAHPELAAPFDTPEQEPGKNPHFWNWDNPLSMHPKRAARARRITHDEYTAACASAPKVFDLTDSYSYMSPGEIGRLRGYALEALVTYTLRDPIEALWSHMTMHSMRPEELLTEPFGARMIANAQVSENLARWQSSKMRLRLIDYDAIVRDPLWVLEQYASALDIDPNWWRARKAELSEHVHKTHNRAPLSLDMRARLTEIVNDRRAAA